MNRPEIFDRVREAFDRGRWVMLTASDGAPQEITIDLKERPDDLFGVEFKTGHLDRDELQRAQAEQRAFYEAGLNFSFVTSQERSEQIARHRSPFLPVGSMEGRPSFMFGSDDHGPAVPAQGDPVPAPGTYERSQIKVYEFTLQDYWAANEEVVEHLADVRLEDALDHDAAAEADWVHVYDRVTRERRTLKRPAPDAVLKGLADVAADLGAEPHNPTPDEIKGLSARIDSAPPLPPVGPLTSTEGLLPGDVLRTLNADAAFGDFAAGDLFHLVVEEGLRHVRFRDREGDLRYREVTRMAFVGRPDADGWMDWPGGENPVGDAMIEARYGDGGASRWPCEASKLAEFFSADDKDDQIVAFRLVDSLPVKSDT